MPCTDTAAGELGSHQSRLGPPYHCRRRGSGRPPASDAGVPGRSTWHHRSVPRGDPDPLPPYWRVLTQGGRLAPSSPTLTEALQARYPDLLSPPRNPIRATPITSVPDATENNVPKNGLTQISPTPMNDSG